MGSITTGPIGLYKPDPTEIVDVVAHLNNNYDDIDAWAALSDTRVISILSPTALATAYPIGPSLFTISAGDMITYPGWVVDPGANSADCINFRIGNRVTQFWVRGTTTNHALYYRILTSSVIGPWIKLGGIDAMSVFDTSNVVIADSTWTRLSLTQLGINDSTNMDQNGGGLRALVDGVYRANIQLLWTGTAAGDRIAGIDVFGATPPITPFQRSSMPGSAGGFGANQQALFDGLIWTAASNFCVWVYQNSGANQNITSRRLFVQRVG